MLGMEHPDADAAQGAFHGGHPDPFRPHGSPPQLNAVPVDELGPQRTHTLIGPTAETLAHACAPGSGGLT